MAISNRLPYLWGINNEINTIPLMVTVHALSTKTFGKAAVKEVKAITPAATSYKIKTVPGCGKVAYIYDVEMNCIGHVYGSYEKNAATYSVKN